MYKPIRKLSIKIRKTKIQKTKIRKTFPIRKIKKILCAVLAAAMFAGLLPGAGIFGAGAGEGAHAAAGGHVAP